MGKLDEIRKKKAELDAEIKKVGKKALGEAFKEMFDALPSVLGVRWEQYTPYFNDGDPCVFRVGDFRYRFEGLADDDGDHEDGYIDEYSMEEDPAHAKLKKPLAKFYEDVVDRDVMLAIFGDHVRVTATRKGFEVEEYQHD